MDMDFLTALLSIVAIDLVLAGDNAVVIALASRNLPITQRNKAIYWGTFGAILIRTLMTLVAVWLLKKKNWNPILVMVLSGFAKLAVQGMLALVGIV